MRYFVLIFLTVFVGYFANSQNKYWVYLNDKEGAIFDPYEYFSPEALERKERLNIPIHDMSDWPLSQKYISGIKNIVDSTGFQSRWLNAVVVYADQTQAEQIKSLPFVKSCEPGNYIQGVPTDVLTDTLVLNRSKRAFIIAQTERMEGGIFIENGIDGTGIRIAVFDIGFKNTDTNPAFVHLREENKIINTWDFVDNDPDVYHYHSHGTQVLSCIAGKLNGLKLGLATGAEFLLARTENNAEKFSEEEYWLAAAEWADKNGADIINSSLGYTHHRYFNDQMDGQTSLVAKAAKMAFQKGILVVNAAGNEGSGKWYYVGTPADVDSVLSIGGISPDQDFHIGFSSFGPTADLRMKPNLCAYGKVICAKKDSVYYSQGTSFSAPLVAGFAACAWQTQPAWNNRVLFEHLERSGQLHPYFDYAHGYGVPQASYFFKEMDKPKNTTFSFVELEHELHIMVEPETVLDNKSEFNHMFYNFQTENGVLSKYAVIDVYREKALSIDLQHLKPGTKLNVWYRGFYNNYIKN